jgi:transcriptional regulator with XRE-family HTH domain
MPLKKCDIKLFVILYNQTNPILNQQQIATQMGVSKSAVSYWLRKRIIRDLIDESRQLIEDRHLWDGFTGDDVQKQKLYLEYKRGKPVQRIDHKVDATVKGEIDIAAFLKAKKELESKK